MSSQSRAGMVGIILGAVFGLAGVFSGIYFGVVQPLQENGGVDNLPVPLIVGSVVLGSLLLAYLAYAIGAQVRKRKDHPSEW